VSAPLFHAEAADELRAVVLWYGERSLRAASEFIGELDDALGKIQGRLGAGGASSARGGATFSTASLS